MPQHKTLTPGHVVVFPNREKAASHTTKAVVVFILLLSAALILIVTVGGWSKLEGMKPINLIWAVVYLILAFYIGKRWARGLLPIAAALGILLLMLAVVAGIGVTGTSWFDRNHAAFAAAKTIFGSRGLGDSVLGLATLLLAPIQALLIFFAMLGFSQGWNVETEVPEEEARRRGYTPTASGPPAAATA